MPPPRPRLHPLGPGSQHRPNAAFPPRRHRRPAASPSVKEQRGAGPGPEPPPDPRRQAGRSGQRGCRPRSQTVHTEDSKEASAFTAQTKGIRSPASECPGPPRPGPTDPNRFAKPHKTGPRPEIKEIAPRTFCRPCEEGNPTKGQARRATAAPREDTSTSNSWGSRPGSPPRPGKTAEHGGRILAAPGPNTPRVKGSGGHAGLQDSSRPEAAPRQGWSPPSGTAPPGDSPEPPLGHGIKPAG